MIFFELLTVGLITQCTKYKEAAHTTPKVQIVLIMNKNKFTLYPPFSYNLHKQGFLQEFAAHNIHKGYH